ncbi:MAG: CinA family nicotinamide mononucleotide deamidase-related protein, partial [Thermomicrobium sp.]|nr:CinA family nicotinamide mononucleotide deamidase-related protein [Thermomicrobium sp.]
MNAVVLSIGTELVDGHLTDTNATFLAQELAALGIRVAWIAQVGDDLPSIVRLLRRAREDASLVVTTGGIGPTEDDLTREAIAALLEEPLTIDPELAERIRAFFAARGLVMPERNLKQAARIPSSEPLPNPIGTAPGWFVQREDVLIVSMPGVPREMTRMWREQVIPRLLPRLGGGVIRFRTVRTIGLGESLVEERLHDLIRRGSPRIATYAKDDGVHVRITVQASDEATATRLLEETEDEVRRRLGRHVYGTDETTLGAAILEPLATAGWSLAVVEQGNGGRFTALLAEEPAAASLVRHCAVLA